MKSITVTLWKYRLMVGYYWWLNQDLTIEIKLYKRVAQ